MDHNLKARNEKFQNSEILEIQKLRKIDVKSSEF